MDCNGRRSYYSYSLMPLLVFLCHYLLFIFINKPSAWASTPTSASTSSWVSENDNFSTPTSLPPTSQEADPETEVRCEKHLLVGQKRLVLPSELTALPDFFSCPANKTVQRCTVVLEAQKFLRDAFKLCFSVSVLLPTYPFTRYKITVSSSLQDVEYKTWKSWSLLNERETCAPPNEELRVVYESDKICSSESGSGLTGFMRVTTEPASRNSISLVTRDSCYKTMSSRTLFSHSTGTIYSSYKPEWSEELNFCKGQINPSYDAVELCFNFERFKAYPGGAWLRIESGQHTLKFDYDNDPKNGDACIDVQGGQNMYVKVIPGNDPRTKFHHTFIMDFRTVLDTSNSYDDDDDYDDDQGPGWWLFVILGFIFLSCTCFCHRCCRRKNGASSNNTPKLYRTDEPMIHPAFENTSSYLAAQRQNTLALTVMSNVPAQGNNYGERGPSTSTPLVQEPSAPPPPPPPDPDALPSYESLFPARP